MTIEETVLGKQTNYPTVYCPEILVAVPRHLNREKYDIIDADELFCGFDSWHAYEVSFVTDNGTPISGVIKLVYPCNNEFLIESKSLKLYLNSLNMEKLGATRKECVTRFLEMIHADLSNALECDVTISFFDRLPASPPFDFSDYSLLEDLPIFNRIVCDKYTEEPELLTENTQVRGGEIKVCSHLLKSNCKITGQPDWGSIYIHIKAATLPDAGDILRYIVSLRGENHFHEEICELTYKRLWDLFHPDILAVTCLYTRRGGIDICPTRANSKRYLPQYLIQHNTLTNRTFRQ